MSVPRRLMTCTAPGCDAAWFQMTEDHWFAIRQAVKRGWDSLDQSGCLCVCREVRCPEHSRPGF